METINIDGKNYSKQQLKIMIDFYNLHHKIDNNDLKELLVQHNITDKDIKGSGKNGSVLKSDRMRVYEQLENVKYTKNVNTSLTEAKCPSVSVGPSLTGIKDVDLLLLKTLPSDKLHKMNINKYNKSLIDEICNDKLKALKITNYQNAYHVALEKGKKEIIKTLLECGKVKPLIPKNLEIDLPYGESTLYDLELYKHKSLKQFAKKFEYNAKYPIIYTGSKLTIHLNDHDDTDAPTITIESPGGLSAAEILYHIAHNLPEDISDIYGDHVYWEGIYNKNGVYYLSLGS